MKKYLFYFLPLLIFILMASRLHAGGGCTFSDNCSSATTITCGSTTAMSNSSCAVNPDCCGCGFVCASPTTCDICGGTLPAHNEDCQASAMGMLCFIEGTFCGSPENTQWARFCPVSSGTYAFNFTSISCSGGGASLQFGIYNAGINCTNNDQTTLLDCNGGFVGTTTVNYALTGGSCYLMVFDGNAGAVCTWSFGITCLPLAAELATFSGNFVSDRTIRLDWTTSTEDNCKEFYIIRRYDDMTRESGRSLDEQMNMREVTNLGPIQPKGGVDKGASYTLFDDQASLPGAYSYELYERETDGSSHYHGMTQVYVNTPEQSAITSTYYNSINDIYMVEFEVMEPSPIQFTLYSSDGKIAEQQYIGEKPAGHHQIALQLKDLSSGIYVMDLRIGGKSFQKKVLVK